MGNQKFCRSEGIFLLAGGNLEGVIVTIQSFLKAKSGLLWILNFLLGCNCYLVLLLFSGGGINLWWGQGLLGGDFLGGGGMSKFLGVGGGTLPILPSRENPETRLYKSFLGPIKSDLNTSINTSIYRLPCFGKTWMWNFQKTWAATLWKGELWPEMENDCLQQAKRKGIEL